MQRGDLETWRMVQTRPGTRIRLPEQVLPQEYAVVPPMRATRGCGRFYLLPGGTEAGIRRSVLAGDW